MTTLHQLCGHCSNNPVEVLGLERSIFISGAIDFFSNKTLNCNKFKEKDDWVQKQVGVFGTSHSWNLSSHQHWPQFSTVETVMVYAVDICLSDAQLIFPSRLEMTNPIISWKRHIYRWHIVSQSWTICFHILIFWCNWFLLTFKKEPQIKRFFRAMTSFRSTEMFNILFFFLLKIWFKMKIVIHHPAHSDFTTAFSHLLMSLWLRAARLTDEWCQTECSYLPLSIS